eukprot:CFRG5926T1
MSTDQLVAGYDVEIKNIPGKGRGLFATRTFSPGDVVLRAKPFAWTVASDRCENLCNECLQPSAIGTLKKCSICKVAWYCGRECQHRAWMRHKLVCVRSSGSGRWLETESTVAQDEAYLLDDLLVRLSATSQNRKPTTIHSQPVPEPTATDVMTMPHPIDASTSDPTLARLVHDRQSTRNSVRMRKSSSSPVFSNLLSVDDISTMILRMKCNNFSIWNDLLVPVGSGCYPGGALLNHSCAPDCVVTYDLVTKTQTFHAIKEIAVGCEVAHSYLDVAESTEKRKEYLRQHYGFDCTCTKCEVSSDSNEYMYAYKDFRSISSFSGEEKAKCREAEQLTTCYTKGIIDLEATGKELEILEGVYSVNNRFLHRFNLVRLKTLCAMHTAYIAHRKFDKDIKVLKEIVCVYRMVYPKNHPMIGLMLYTLGDVLMASRTENTDVPMDLAFDIVESYMEAHAILSITHGTSSPFVLKLHDMIEDYTAVKNK